MKVSLITATYNSEATLAHTLKSVGSQRYTPIEHIIVDGKSTDGTQRIVETFGNQISKFISEKDTGIYDAMNKGVQLATGDIVGIINSDDFYVNDLVISKVVDAFERYGVDSVYGDLQYVDPSDTHKIVRNWKAGAFNKRSFLFGWMPPHPTFFVKKELYEKYGLFDTSLKSSADYELMLRMLYKNGVSAHYIPEVLVKMRTGGQSNFSLKNRWLANEEDRSAWKKNNLTPKCYTTILKPLRKITQYITI